MAKKRNEVISLPHYWICHPCAVSKGGTIPLNSCNTVHEDICPYCGKTDTVFPIVDFDWKDKSKAHFKLCRD